MRTYRKLAPFLLLLLCFTTLTTALAQDAETCAPLLQQAMTTAQQGCAATGRNQACYGYFNLQATPQAGVQNFTFAQQGDIVDVADLGSLKLAPLDAGKDTWGIALMKLQANLPDALPGQNVTFVLFGSVEIRNDVSATATGDTSGDAMHPMQAFYFSTGVGKTSCAGAPADGIVIQTPKGAGKINLRANNVDVELGSTAYFQAQPGATMNVRVVEGEGRIASGGKLVTVPAGAMVTIPVDDDLNAIGEPSDPEAYDESDVEFLPVDLLPDEIEIADPADEETIQQALDETEYDDSYAGDDAELDNSDSSDAEFDSADNGQDDGQDENAPDNGQGDSGDEQPGDSGGE